MIINKVDNCYIIKLFKQEIDIYNPNELEYITKKIIKKITLHNNLKNTIYLEFYLNKNYGTIIKLTDYNSPFSKQKEKIVKITIHTDTPFLYQTDYFNIKENNLSDKNVYYYKNKFYIEIINEITTKDYYQLLEQSDIIYEDTYLILDKGIKI